MAEEDPWLTLKRGNAFPYQTPVALTYDTGDYQRTLDAALRLADYAGFPALE